MTTSRPSCLRRATAAAELGLTVSATAIAPTGSPSTATVTTVLPSPASARGCARRPSGAAASRSLPATTVVAVDLGRGRRARRSPRTRSAGGDREAALVARPRRSPPPAGARSRARPGRQAQQPRCRADRRCEVAAVPDPNRTTSVTARLALGDGAGLVEHDGVELVRRLQRLAAADQDAVLGALAGADHDRRRRGEAQRARAGDDEHGDEVEQRVVERRRRAEDQPDDQGERRDDDDGRHEAGGDDVGQPRDGRLGALRLLDQADDLRQRRVARRPWWPGSVNDPCVLMVAPMTSSPGSFSTGMRLAGEHGLVDRARSPPRPRRPPAPSRRAAPRRGRRRSTCATGTSTSAPPRTTRAVLGCRPISALIAAPVCPLARASSSRPSRISVMMTAAESKYIGSPSPWCSKNAGKRTPSTL